MNALRNAAAMRSYWASMGIASADWAHPQGARCTKAVSTLFKLCVHQVQATPDWHLWTQIGVYNTALEVILADDRLFIEG